MILKIIHALVPEGARDLFVERQRIWTAAMLQEPGFEAVDVALDPMSDRHVTVVIRVASRADLDRFMAGPHDGLLEATRMREVFERLDVRVLDVVDHTERSAD